MKPEKVVQRATDLYRVTGQTRHTSVGIDESTNDLRSYSWLPTQPCPIPVEVKVIIQLGPGELDRFVERMMTSYGPSITEREAQMLVIRPRVVRALLRPPPPKPKEVKAAKVPITYAIKHAIQDDNGYLTGKFVVDYSGITRKPEAIRIARYVDKNAMDEHRKIIGHALRDDPLVFILNEVSGRLYTFYGEAL